MKRLAVFIMSAVLICFFTAPVFGEMLAHWTFDETSGTSVADSAGNANGVLSGGADLSISGPIGSALMLDGGDDYMDGFQIELVNDWSISFWAQPLDPDQWQGLFGSPGGTGGNYIQLQSNRFHYKGNQNLYYSYTQDLGWHHYALTRSSSGAVAMYIDGVATNYSDPDATFTISQIGRFWDNSNYSYEGGIDDAAIWDTVLGTAEIQQIYDNGLQGIAVPEPATIGFMLLGFGAAACRRRR